MPGTKPPRVKRTSAHFLITPNSTLFVSPPPTARCCRNVPRPGAAGHPGRRDHPRVRSGKKPGALATWYQHSDRGEIFLRSLPHLVLGRVRDHQEPELRIGGSIEGKSQNNPEFPSWLSSNEPNSIHEAAGSIPGLTQ